MCLHHGDTCWLNSITEVWLSFNISRDSRLTTQSHTAALWPQKDGRKGAFIHYFLFLNARRVNGLSNVAPRVFSIFISKREYKTQEKYWMLLAFQYGSLQVSSRLIDFDKHGGNKMFIPGLDLHSNHKQNSPKVLCF